MRNTLADLNNYLFEQIERLQDDELSEEKMQKEIQKSKAIGSLANSIISNAALALDAQKFLINQGINQKLDIPLLGISDKNEI
jgi:phage protein|nr:MAG TPA: hypothetical protein [Caudoviricetes sp.]